MSSLYLVLRRRLEDVTGWVDLDTATLRSARKAKGYSYEAMGRRLNLAAKTWERWEKKGRVRRHMLDRVAEELDLEIDRPAPQRVTMPVADERVDLAAVVERLVRLEAVTNRILDAVLADGRSAPAAPRADPAG